MTELRVAFADTDAMGIVHHSNYLRYFEVARVQWLRERGVNYLEWSKKGYHLPLIEIRCRYKQPARFEDVLTISVKPALDKARVNFEYEITNKETRALIATGSTLHVPVDHNMKVIKPPKDLTKALMSLT